MRCQAHGKQLPCLGVGALLSSHPCRLAANPLNALPVHARKQTHARTHTHTQTHTHTHTRARTREHTSGHTRSRVLAAHVLPDKHTRQAAAHYPTADLSRLEAELGALGAELARRMAEQGAAPGSEQVRPRGVEGGAGRGGGGRGAKEWLRRNAPGLCCGRGGSVSQLPGG